MDNHPIFIFFVKVAVIAILCETAELISRMYQPTHEGVPRG